MRVQRGIKTGTKFGEIKKFIWKMKGGNKSFRGSFGG